MSTSASAPDLSELVPPELHPILIEGLQQFRVPLTRLAFEAVQAEEKALPFALAAEQCDEYPLIARFHHGLLDLLQFELPVELAKQLQRILATAVDWDFGELRRQLFFAASGGNRTAPAAFLRFVLYQALRLNVWILTWDGGERLEVDGSLEEIDQNAELLLRDKLESSNHQEPDGRPLELVVAETLIHLQAAAAERADEIRRARAEARLHLDRLEEGLRIARMLDARDAALLRDEVREERGGAPMGAGKLLQLHPMAFRSRDAIYKRRERLREKLKTREMGSLERTKPRLIDLLLNL